MGITDPPIWVHTAIDSIPSVKVSFGSFGMGFININIQLGSFDDYPHTDEMATSAASFIAYEDDGDRAVNHPSAIESVALNELNLHLPAPDTEDEETARAAAQRVLPERYDQHLRLTLRPLADGAWSPHVKLQPDAREDLDHDDLRSILQHIVREHPSFEYDEAEAGEYIDKDAIDHVVAEAERLRED